MKPEKDSASITMNILNMKHKVNVKIIKFGVNSNKGTTGHKLQGVSLNRMVVRSWNYRCNNWIYVVLSRLRTLNGLFLCEKLDDTKSFDVDPKLLEEEKRLQFIEKSLIDFVNKNKTNI